MITRRLLLRAAAALPTMSVLPLGAGAGCTRDVSGSAAHLDPAPNGPMAYELPPLPYSSDALEPHITAKTLGFHHGKHHAGYVKKLNAAVEGSVLSTLPLEDVVREAAGKPEHTGLFNNAAQAWNHAFYWQSMAPGGGGKPEGRMLAKLEGSFGSYEKFREQFAAAAGGRFGSGWAWLVEDKGKLAVLSTANADTPMARGVRCLLVCDVWEHAYYLDYQNRRPEYVDAFLDHLVNWEFAEKNLG